MEMIRDLRVTCEEEHKGTLRYLILSFTLLSLVYLF